MRELLQVSDCWRQRDDEVIPQIKPANLRQIADGLRQGRQLISGQVQFAEIGESTNIGWHKRQLVMLRMKFPQVR